jgi:rRNA maturation RNase YbeY
MKIEINNRQNLLKINKRKIQALAAFLMEKAGRLIPERRWSEVSLVITDDALMTSVNEQFTGDTCTTDVLSFCLPPMPDDAESYTGEVFVNAEIALARKNSGSIRELALYIAHGCDHLMDEDDEDAASQRRMRRRELGWLREADTLSLIDGIAAKD